METSSSEGAIPATNINDEEDHAILKKDRRADELEVAHAMLLLAQPPSATTSIRLRLRRSPSPVADQRISQWKNENRAFKGTITRQSKSVGAAGPAEAARAAQRSALMVDGQPQFVMFCDGSSVYSGPNATSRKDGGYAVVFRDPYDADKAATASASESATAKFAGSRNEDGITIGDFTIRHWLSHRTFGNGHTEIAALAQALEEVTQRVDQHQPDTSIVKIFTDCDGSLSRLQKGILTFETTTAAHSRKRKRKLTRKEKADTSFFAEHTNPFVQVIVWQSHYLSDRGCTIEINWMPRNTTLGHRLADHMAGLWRGKEPGDASFNQKYLPHAQRDGISDKLHEVVSAIERERPYGALDSQQRPKKKKKIKRATRTQERSTSDYIALLDSPSDYIALDSESEEELEQPPKKKQKIKGATTAKQRSTSDFNPLGSDSEEEPVPQPQPPKKKQKMEGAIKAQKRSTVDYILLDSDSEEEPEPKLQTPKKRKKIRGAIPPKKKRAQTQQAGPGAGGFLHGEDHVFNFDPGNLPSYPSQHASHDPDSGHGTPGCLLCQGDDYPWTSGYTGLPSQWALTRY